MKFLWKKIKTGTEELSLKEQFLETVSEEIKVDLIYLALVVFSTIIATLGLLTDSAAVVIGAMLISPIAWPMFGLAASITTTRKRLVQRSLLSLVVSVGVVLAVSILVTGVVPGHQITDEIRLRTDPNLLDLFIALASAVIGVLAVYFPQISASLSGVAMAVALLPPLCVAGIGIARRSWEMFNGSFLLFAANMGAIVFVGAVTLYFLGFKPRREEESARFEFGLLLSSVFIVALSIPLAIYFFESVGQAETRRVITQTLEDEVQKLYGTAELDGIVIGFGDRGEQINVQGTVYLAEGDYLTVGQQEELIGKLADESGMGVNLQLNLVNTLVLRRAEDEEVKRLRSEVVEFVGHELERLGSDLEGDDVRVVLPTEKSKPIQVSVLIRQNGDLPFSVVEKTEMLVAMETRFGREFDLEVEYLPVTKVGGVSQVALLEKEAKIYLEEKLGDLDSRVEVEKVSIDFSVEQLSILEEVEQVDTQVLGIQTLTVKVLVYAPLGFEIEDEEMVRGWEEELSELLGFDLGLEFRVVEYGSLRSEN